MTPRIGGMLFIRIAALASALAVFSACGVGPGALCGTEHQDPDEVVVGCVDQENGGPAVGVRVVAVPVGGGRAGAGKFMAGASVADSAIVRQVDTAWTNSNGRYTFDKKLAPGEYDLYFEDTGSHQQDKRPIQRYVGAYRKVDSAFKVKAVTMRNPLMLMVKVTEQDRVTPIVGANCKIENTPYTHSTNKLGIAVFYMPKATYNVSCILVGETQAQSSIIEVSDDSGGVGSFSLFVTDSRANALSAPENLRAVYDSITGVVRVSWSPVEHRQLTGYGLRRVDVDLGGGPKETPANDTTFNDVAFADTLDSLQQKHFLYSIYSLRSKIYEIGSRQVELRVVRPLAMGPRIDTIFALAPDYSYQPGDTALIVAEWRNRIRGNDTLYWRVKGASQVMAGTKNPPASGRDTLAFPVTAAGYVEIGITIRDAEGYRSWDSRTFRFGSP